MPGHSRGPTVGPGPRGPVLARAVICATGACCWDAPSSWPRPRGPVLARAVIGATGACCWGPKKWPPWARFGPCRHWCHRGPLLGPWPKPVGPGRPVLARAVIAATGARYWGRGPSQLAQGPVGPFWTVVIGAPVAGYWACHQLGKAAILLEFGTNP